MSVTGNGVYAVEDASRLAHHALSQLVQYAVFDKKSGNRRGRMKAIMLCEVSRCKGASALQFTRARREVGSRRPDSDEGILAIVSLASEQLSAVDA